MNEPMNEPTVSIVMPVLNEASIVEAAICRLRNDFPDCELLVVDGGSSDGTVERAAAHARVIASARGRALQMNAGAAHATGAVLWFVHADTVLQPSALRQLRDALRDPCMVGGGLTLRFDASSAGLRFLAWTSNMRAHRLHWIFGDQAMFVRREVFESVGGFPGLPLMEDLELSRRLAAVGQLAVVPATSTASARRFVENGTWRMVAFMQWLKFLHFAGADPADIARRYARGPRLLPGRRVVPEEIARAVGS